MKKLFLLSLLFCALHINAQTIKIEYEVIFNRNSVMLSTKSDYYYILSNNKSIYYNNGDSINIYTNIDETPEIIRNKKDIKILKLDDSHYASLIQEYFYKNYFQDTLLYNRYYQMKRKNIVIGESLNIFNWKIIPKSDTVIINYKCKKAVATFRGRDYEAFFSEELASLGGPWKFDGLPGLILSVRSKDNYFIINSVKLSISPKSEEINNPFKKEKYIFSWEEYKTDVHNSIVKTLKAEKADLLPGESSAIRITDEIEDIGFYRISTDDF